MWGACGRTITPCRSHVVPKVGRAREGEGRGHEGTVLTGRGLRREQWWWGGEQRGERRRRETGAPGVPASRRDETTPLSLSVGPERRVRTRSGSRRRDRQRLGVSKVGMGAVALSCNATASTSSFVAAVRGRVAWGAGDEASGSEHGRDKERHADVA